MVPHGKPSGVLTKGEILLIVLEVTNESGLETQNREVDPKDTVSPMTYSNIFAQGLGMMMSWRG